MRVGLSRSTSSAQVDGQSCGQALCTMSGLAPAGASKAIVYRGRSWRHAPKYLECRDFTGRRTAKPGVRRRFRGCIVTSAAAAGQLQFKPKVGVLYMLAAITVLGSTDAIVKWTSATIDPIQIGFSRFVISLIAVLWMVGRSQPGFAALRTKRPLEHAARAFCAAVELTAFYFAISLIPLPTAMSIVSASPIFGTLLGIVFLRERLRLG